MNKKTVLITGASRGIGRACAHIFAKKGFSLVVTCQSSEKKLLELTSEIIDEYGVECLPSVGDIGDSDYVNTLFAEIQLKFGHLDILINNAGISHIGLLQEMELDEWSQLMNTNVTSTFLCSKAAIPMMLSQGAGSIVNISSVWGNVGASCEVAYSASKGALNSFTKALGKELAPSNIRVNAIALGAIDTEMNKFLSVDEKLALESEIPLGRMGTATEAADLIADIAINHPCLTAQVITMDGGWS
jgi:Dehydrogenases with different specificities (related to short-chain alcohol dehydrogenases)